MPVEEVPPVEELKRWEAKALKSFKRFKRADVAFDTDAIPFPEQVRIHDALKVATDTASIKAAFKGVDALLDSVDAEARRKWVEEAGNARDADIFQVTRHT
jgi:hypothetical protein